MNADLAVSIGSIVISLLGSVAITSYRYGILREQVNELRTRMAGMASKDDLTGIRESLAEIKGMFRLELKDK
jgi:hypothetical protein